VFHVLRISDLKTKEVINIVDGRRVGLIGDLDIDLEVGRIKAIVVPGPGKILGLFGRDSDAYIPWEKIVRIGLDVILVDLPSLDRPYDEDDDYR
jgi:YlmC/YmxH family sporulation protein